MSKITVRIETTRTLESQADFSAYCELLKATGVPPYVVNALRLDGYAEWVSEDAISVYETSSSLT